MNKIDIKSLSLNQLKELLIQRGEPAFRAGQVYSWLHQKRVSDFSEMTNISKTLREQWRESFAINTITVQRKLVSKIDGTTKFLYRLQDGETVESVLMQYHHGYSICISTQVGCKMGCTFCASTLAGYVRNLTPAEMLDQIYQAEKESGQTIQHVVLMGIGEPLDNFDNVVAFLKILQSPEGKNLSLRNVSLSTCGLVEQIRELAEYRFGLTLSVSLHAPNDALRATMMPVNRRYPIEELLAACREYIEKTGRRISFEHAVIAGVNDSIACAEELAMRLRGMLCHVNLIPVNEVKEREYRASERSVVYRFQKLLTDRGINATVRRTLGSDIEAACGQLRREEAVKKSGK